MYGLGIEIYGYQYCNKHNERTHQHSTSVSAISLMRRLTTLVTWRIIACAASSASASRSVITTLRAAVRYEEVIKKSRFIAVAAPATTAEAAGVFVKELSDQKARHNCFAWRLANGATRTNGDGEPGGTAGRAIADVRTRMECTHIAHAPMASEVLTNGPRGADAA